MIIVEVKLHSYVTGETKILQTLVLDNIGVNETGNKASYRCRVMAKGQEWLDLAYGKLPIRKAEVHNHSRHSKPILNLVYKALIALGYDK